ncbi:hypothetical protein N781_14415 [Pontibacillus halophilus JSM 076056 = DSM 19796]|uniref:Uncharacterized protein n=1 Tax=Pontibacillus halophilus JSM 076056 = DSM 19796 TaxID=1385510 RepID=A0A0A5GL80_9BACI|nr:hypothetical protein [Pontibacillus halophilus]KGX92764.1 hypothetical protein N781_14415 [Pontibacillus halophilus JSM 076056 = DSM 19796]
MLKKLQLSLISISLCLMSLVLTGGLFLIPWFVGDLEYSYISYGVALIGALVFVSVIMGFIGLFMDDRLEDKWFGFVSVVYNVFIATPGLIGVFLFVQ